MGDTRHRSALTSGLGGKGRSWGWGGQVWESLKEAAGIQQVCGDGMDKGGTDRVAGKSLGGGSLAGVGDKAESHFGVSTQRKY